MVEEQSLEYWCDMMVKTYNTSILDNFPTSLKRSLQEEATRCVESKPNPNYYRSVFGLIKKKKNRNVLMRLINNYFRSKQIKTMPTIDFIGGPYTLTLHWSSKYNKIIYIFGEYHRNDVCTYDNMMLVEDFIRRLFRYSIAFIDCFLETKSLIKGRYCYIDTTSHTNSLQQIKNCVYPINTSTSKRLNMLLHQNKKCIESIQRQENRECDNRRVHFINIRSGQNTNSTVNFNIYFNFYFKNFFDQFLYIEDRQNESIFIRYKFEVINLLNHMFNDKSIKPTLDFILYGSEETYKEFCDKEIETHELLNRELSKSPEERKIREFADEEFAKIRDEIISISYEMINSLIICSDERDIYNFHKLSNADYIKFFVSLTKVYNKILLFNAILVDIYTLARMFKKFQVNNTRNTRKTDEPEEPHNIIMYAGDAHSENVRRFLHENLGFDLISESKGDFRVDLCVDIRHFEQPFFSSWPPKKMPQIQRKLMSEEMLPNPQFEIEPMSEEMLSSDFQIQTTSMNEIDEKTGLEVLKYESMLKYKGSDVDFIHISGIEIDMELAKIDITFYPDEIKYYNYYDYYYQLETYNAEYKVLAQISNSIHSEDLTTRFPFLENLKHVDYLTLFLSVQKALESKFTTPESNIVIEIRSSYNILNQSEYIRKLVEFYEKIGFQKMFPTQYEDAMERINKDMYDYIPMIGKVENITDVWSVFENMSVLLNFF